MFLNKQDLIAMIISHKHKFIFVKTFKTAGSSIENYLQKYLGPNDIIRGSQYDNTPSLNAPSKGRHASVQQIKEWYPNDWNDEYFSFCVERNPWNVAVSYYFYMKHAGRIKSQTFDEWIKVEDLQKLNNYKKYTINNKVVVNKVLKYENLESDINNIPVPYNGELKTIFLKKGHRPSKDYKIHYTDETRKLIEDNFAETISMFGYTYED